jgi:predicted rRNA methylase YqxC with S4 and FtsJ domains
LNTVVVPCTGNRHDLPATNMAGERLDQALVERGLCESREKARRAIMAGQVLVNQQPARKASERVSIGDNLSLAEVEKYVSRGGLKLEHALHHFHLDVTGQTAVDLGASTGGFTDCLLQHGAAFVYAVDVGHAQLSWKLRQDPRVIVMEKTNARLVTPSSFQAALDRITEPERLNQSGGAHAPPRVPTGAPAGPGESPSEVTSASRVVGGTPTTAREGVCAPLGVIGGAPTTARYGVCSPHPKKFSPVDLVVIDCSFISLRRILPVAVALLRGSGRMAPLIKPQFEAGKAEADKGRGVITDPAIHARVLRELEEFVRAQPGLAWRGSTESPLLGPAGNKEFFALIEKTGQSD